MQPPTLLPARALSVPVTPDAEEARRAAEEELSKPAYRERRSLWEALWDWLASHLDPGAVLPGLPAWAGWVIVLSVLAALVAVMVLMLGRLRMVRRARSLGAGLFDSDHRDARTLVQAADSAAAEGLWATAVIERFRAIIRSLDERGLVEDYPGMTAQEAAARAGSALGAVEDELDHAATLFDSVRYGEINPSREQDEWMRALAHKVAALRPHSAAGRASPAPAATTTGRGADQ